MLLNHATVKCQIIDLVGIAIDKSILTQSPTKRVYLLDPKARSTGTAACTVPVHRYMRTQTPTKRVYLLDPNEVDNLALDGRVYLDTVVLRPTSYM